MQKKFLLIACIFVAFSPVFGQKIAELYKKDKYPAIIRIAEEADSTTSFSTLDLYQIGRSYFHEDHIEKALTYFQKALAAGRDSANVHYFIGVCHKEFKQFDKAMAAFDEAIKRDSTDQYTWTEKAMVYYNQEKITAAITAFEKAVEMPYQYEYPYFVLLNLYALNKNFDKMSPFYKKWETTIAKSDHYQIEAWKLMGNIEKTQYKNLDKALDYFEKALEKDILSIKSYENVMKIYTTQEKWKKVDKVFEKLKTAFEDKRLDPEDLKREAAVVDDIMFNDTINILSVRYFKKPEEFAEPIYKSYLIDVPKDSTYMVILTEKSLSFDDEKADNHMLCGRRGGSHLNYGMITRDGHVEFADYKKRVLAIVKGDIEPGASSTSRKKKQD
jgi:tetratricopeptide (TPR) repeat protein